MIKTDVLIVGAGPAGLATAISLKRRGFPGRVVVLEKGRTVGAHVLSGAVIDPSGFKGLLSEDEIAGLPVEAKVTRESFRLILGPGMSLRIPWVPPMMRARGYPVGSLARIARHLADIAKSLGVEIYTGFAVTELIEESGRVVGARTGEKGLDAAGTRKSSYLPGEDVRTGQVVLAEGAAGILTDRLIAAHGLSGRRPQTYALGLREIVELPEAVPDSAGEILHTFGHPVDPFTYGGGFVYHLSDRRVAVGYAVGLDYRKAGLNPHELLRRYKETSAVRRHIAGGRVIAYGAKLIPEGGFYSMPRPCVPGALIVGDGAGLLDGLRIKGVHLALQSGMAAAAAIAAGAEDAGGRYLEELRMTRGYREVKRVRNVHGGFSRNALLGVLQAGLAWATFGRFPFWMVGSRRRDCDGLRRCRAPAESGRREATPLSPSILDDVFMSGTVHEENQPSHVRIADAAVCSVCEERYGSPCTRFCPAEVYVRSGDAVRVDFSNCLHCKTCVDKCPFGNVTWNFPQGGDGPRYV